MQCSNPDAKQVLKVIRISNVKKLISRQLNMNSVRNKFDMLIEPVKGTVDVFVISETA